MLALPRSVLLALWANAVLAGRAAIDEAVPAVLADDEDLGVTGDDLPFSGHPSGPRLGDWLDQLASRGVRGCWASLPVPGDLAGLHGGPSVTDRALEAGEAVLTVADPHLPGWVLVPHVSTFGSDLDWGTAVLWRSIRVERPRPSALDPVEAEQRLQHVLLRVTAGLEGLDVAGGEPGPTLDNLRRRPVDHDDLPPGMPAASARLLDRAARLQLIAAGALDGEGAVVTAQQSNRRRELLRELEAAARFAIMAATAPEV